MRYDDYIRCVQTREHGNEFISRVFKEGPMINCISIIPVGESESDKGVNDFLSPCLPSDVR